MSVEVEVGIFIVVAVLCGLLFWWLHDGEYR
jgi:hypothetical protein